MCIMRIENYLWSFYGFESVNFDVVCPLLSGNFVAYDNLFLVPAIQKSSDTQVLTIGDDQKPPFLQTKNPSSNQQKLRIGSPGGSASFNYVRIGAPPPGNDKWLDRSVNPKTEKDQLLCWVYNSHGSNQDWSLVRYEGCFYQIKAPDKDLYIVLNDDSSIGLAAHIP